MSNLTIPPYNASVALVTDLASVSPSSSPVIVKDSLRGGIFNWSATGAANGGTVFAGLTGFWVRQYSGGIDPKWFGAKADNATDDTVSVQAALTYASSISSYLSPSPGTYVIGDELVCLCSVKGTDFRVTYFRSTISTSSIVTKYKLQAQSSKQVVAYEGTAKAVFNCDGVDAGQTIEGITIGTNIYLASDADIATLPPVTGIRAGRAGNLIANPASNRSNKRSVYIHGLHTAFDVTGWILDFDDIFITSCKTGIVASEFNNVNATIKMESVVQPFNIYDATQVNITSFANEGNLTWQSSYFDACRSFSINGIYMEGGVAGDSLYKIGTRTPVDITLPASTMACVRFDIQRIDNVIASEFPTFSVDRVDGIKLTGTAAYLNSRPIIATANTFAIDLSGLIYGRLNGVKTNALPFNTIAGSASRQYLPNNFLKYFEASYGISGYLSPKVATSIAKVTSDGEIRPLTGNSMLKLININAGGVINSNIKFVLHNTEMKKHFVLGDTICFGAWVYVPAQTYDKATANNNPYIEVDVISTANGSQFGSVTPIRSYDCWSFVYTTLTLSKDDLDYIYLSFWLSNGVEKPDGTYIYIDSMYMTKGAASLSYLLEQQFNSEPSPFGVDTGDHMLYHHGADTIAEYDLNGSLGDRIANPARGSSGRFQELQCTAHGNRAAAGGWIPVTLPPLSNIPVTNQGANTIWSNSGVLTLGT